MTDIAPRINWDVIAGRAPYQLDSDAVRRRVHGQVVMVTGAAGSLGAPLAMALADAGPERLVLYDQHESSLFHLREALIAAHPELPMRAILGDVRHRSRVGRIVLAERPNLLFHLAAYKHVPWGEEDPQAFIEVNVLGALSIIDAAREAGVAQIVYPSTDKAIDPPSLYGATKRMVEAMLFASTRTGGPRCTVVRFVNVLGSRGSAPEKFARQVQEGKPLSVTDPRMRRYWITPDHARILLLHAACVDEDAIIVAPDAGAEITVLEIARRMVQALHPLAGEPQIAVTGPRPGERLAEPMTATFERLEPLPLPGILAVRGGQQPDPDRVRQAVSQLEALLDRGAEAHTAREALFEELTALQSVPAVQYS
jgi:FlaA1/EpsC-like NDP-sugar epimerase